MANTAVLGRPKVLLLFLLALGIIEGSVYNLVPVTFPAFRTEFGLGLEQMGRMQLILFTATLLFSITGGWFAGAIGLRRATAGTVCILAAGLLAVGTTRRFAFLETSVFVLGLSFVAITVVTCTSITVYFPELRQRAFFLLGLMNAVGATVFPALLGWWVKRGEWREAYLITGGVMLVLALAAYAFKWLWQPEPSQLSSDEAWKHLPEVLSSTAIYGLSIVMFLHGLAQVGMVSWIGQLYIKRGGVDPAEAALFISFNSAGFFAGRTLLTWITGRWKIHELVVLGCCAGVGTLCYVATILSGTYAAGLVAFTLAGVFISGNGPSVNSYMGQCYPNQAATAFALMNGFGNIGAAAGTYVVGAIGSRAGLEHGIWFLPVFSATLSAFALLWFLQARGQPERSRVLASTV